MADAINVSEKLALSVAETAAVLGVSKPTVYELLRQDGFPRLKVGARTLIPKQGLETWVSEQTRTS